jgi:drug/metabolite transporter (DMT)-like permease
MLLAGALLVGFLLFKNRAALKITWTQLFSLSLLGLFSIYLTNALEFWGLQQMTAAKTCFFYSLSPFFAALFSYLHFGEKMNGRKWLGMAIGFTGFIPVLMAQKGSGELLSSLQFISWPELAVLGAALCSVYGWTLLRLMVKDKAISPWAANGISMLIGGGLALVHSMLVEPWTPLPVSLEGLPVFAQSTLLMTFISNILCYNLYGMLLKRFTSTFLSFMGLLSPIFASVNSWLLLGEPLSPTILMATGVVVIGLWLVYSAELKQGYIKRSSAPIESV